MTKPYLYLINLSVMKILLFLISLFLSAQLLHAQTWSWSSESPVAGNDLTVTVKGIDIEDGTHVIGYYFTGNDLVTSDINYIIEDGAMKMTLKVPETNWIRLVIKDQEFQPIAGDHRDVVWAGTPAKSSLIDFANATAAYYRIMGIDRDEKEVTKMYRDAIAANPTWLDNPVVLRSYYNMAKAAKAEEDLKRIHENIMACEAKSDPASQDVLITAMRIAKETGDTVLYKSLRAKLDQTYPQSIASQEDHLTLFTKASSLADKITLREEFKSKYPLNEFNKHIYDRMTQSLIKECAAKDDHAKMKDYINELMDPSTKADVCNEYAWTLAGEGLENEALDLDLASELSAASLQLMNPTLKKPATMSQSEWERRLESMRANYGDTYAIILYKQGKYDDALEHQLRAVQMYDYREPEMNERYAIYLDKAGKHEEFLSFTEEMIKSGHASSKMKEMHEELWTKKMTHEQLYDHYIMQLEAIAKMKRLEEIKAMWMDADAAHFTLKDLDGKTVSLADFKGKTVVLDFWATWCGPCKASFPGMKNAVEHYASDNNVAFLFIDTWERGKDIPEKVKKFITDNNYPFHVLMDLENTVVNQYKVEGIPTKFVIGPDQKVRFKSVGFGGNNDVLVEELITMIDLAQNGGKMVTP